MLNFFMVGCHLRYIHNSRANINTKNAECMACTGMYIMPLQPDTTVVQAMQLKCLYVFKKVRFAQFFLDLRFSQGGRETPWVHFFVSW
jgi:hypothetical protein